MRLPTDSISHWSNGYRPTTFALLLLLLVGCSLLAPKVVMAQGQKQFSSADLLLKDIHGPWLILAASFEGDDAKQKAVQLAAELRKDFKLMAYCSPKQFDYSRTVSGAGFDSTGAERKMRHQNDTVVETCAVLIGDFDAMDGVDIDDTLKRVKQINPKCFGTAQGSDPKSAAHTVSALDYREYLRKLSPKKEPKEDFQPGPMKYAFKTRNPLLPADYYKSPQVDQFVRKMNQESPFNEHNLLNSSKKFTVRVLTLRGTDSFVSWGRGSDAANTTVSDQLAKAAERAHLVTKTLRLAGYEAYQFHDRYQSIVCVGGFDSLGKPREDESFQYDPGILEVIKRFGSTGTVHQSKYGASEKPRMLLDELVDSKIVPELQVSDRKVLLENFSKLTVPFDLIPTPMMVPKLEASSIYSNFTLGK